MCEPLCHAFSASVERGRDPQPGRAWLYCRSSPSRGCPPLLLLTRSIQHHSQHRGSISKHPEPCRFLIVPFRVLHGSVLDAKAKEMEGRWRVASASLDLQSWPQTKEAKVPETDDQT